MDQQSRGEHSIGRAFDVLCVAAALAGARELVSHLNSRGLFIYPPDWAAQFWRLALIAFAGWIAASTYTQLYRTSLLEETTFEVRSLLRTFLLYALISIGALFVVKLQNVSRQFMAYTLLLTAAAISIRHFAATIYYTRLKRFGYDWRTALVVGNRAQCKRFSDLFDRIGPIGYRLVPSPVDGEFGSQTPSFDHDLPDADDAFVLPGALRQDQLILQLLKEGKSVHIVPELFDARLFRRSLGDLGGAPVVSIWTGRLTVLQAVLKRAADVAGAVFLLLVLSPLFLIIAMLIKLTSKGPIWFSQKRLGRMGKPFYIYKFRTMVADAETILKNAPGLYEKYVANNYKLPNKEDPRITRLGAVLRASSLDELPQLLNVLKGEMSLVGPRPIVVAEVEKYSDYAALFLSAKPGMTGHWQVCGRSDIEDYGRRVELDLEYLRDQSLGKDVEILLRTVPSVLLRKGAH